MRKVKIDEFGVITGLRCYFKGGGGSGSSGGGSSSGAIDYPDYMKTFHGQALNNSGADTLTSSLVALINTAQSNNPFTGENAFDPDTDLAAMETALAGFDTLLSGISPITSFDSYIADAITRTGTIATNIAAIDVTAHAVAVADGLGDAIDNENTTKVLPRFQRGMQDINAVQSSTFVIGQAVIEGFRDVEVARATSQFLAQGAGAQIEGRIKAQLSAIQGVELITKLLVTQLDYEKAYMLAVLEQRRLKIVAKGEQNETDRSIDESEASWDLEVVQHGANMLAAIAGGTIAPVSGSGRSQAQRSSIGGAISGALSGAAAGAMIGAQIGAVGGPMGAGIGAVLGIGASLL